MYLFFLDKIVKPAIRRSGTVIGTYLLGLGMTQELVAQVVLSLTALATFAADLIMSHLAKK
jgi:hypothetical protein